MRTDRSLVGTTPVTTKIIRGHSKVWSLCRGEGHPIGLKRHTKSYKLVNGLLTERTYADLTLIHCLLPLYPR